MYDTPGEAREGAVKTIPVQKAVGTVLAHDITEIRAGEFKGRAFKKGHVIREEDVCHLQRLGKDQLFVLDVADDEMHENEAAWAIATALLGNGAVVAGEPKEGKINIIAERDGLLKIDREALRDFNLLGAVMCATMHSNTLVKKGQVVAGTRAIPLVVKKSVIERAVRIASQVRNAECRRRNEKERSEIRSPNSGMGRSTGIIEVKELRRPRAGVVITGNEVYHGRIKDAFAPIIKKKIDEFGGEVIGVYYAPDDMQAIEERMRELLGAGADLLITTGGMSVDPDDVTRFAIRNLGASDITYGSAALPGAMFLVAYMNGEWGERKAEIPLTPPSPLRGEDTGEGWSHSKPRTPNTEPVPILGIPACGMYHKITVLDLVLPRVLAGERIGRLELAELGHGGLCLNCSSCRYPLCPFGK